MSKKSLDGRFENWLRQTTLLKVSKILEVSENTVRHWIDGRALPKARQMKRIKEITKGKIGYTAIIEGSCSPLNR